MEQNIIKPGSKRRNRSDIMLLLDEFAVSGMTVQSFCSQYKIGKSTFHKWQSRYKDTQKPSTSKAFADVEIVTGQVHQCPALFAEVNGIKLYRPVTAAYLKELLL